MSVPSRSLSDTPPPDLSAAALPHGANAQHPSVSWLLAGGREDAPWRESLPEREPIGSERRADGPRWYRVALAGFLVVVLGGIALLTPSSVRTSLFSAPPEKHHAPDKTLAALTEPAVRSTAPPFPAPGPKVILVGPAEKAISSTPPVIASLPPPEQTPRSPAPQTMRTQTPQGGAPKAATIPIRTIPEPALARPAATISPVRVPAPATPPVAAAAGAPIASAQPVAGNTSTVVAAAAEPFKVRLTYTADETQKAEALAHQLQREGLEVTSILIPPTTGRWPGVAFFFPSDRDEATAIARQLTDITGRHEHARLSDRHPYPKAGTIEVSLLKSEKPKTRAERKRIHAD